MPRGESRPVWGRQAVGVAALVPLAVLLTVVLDTPWGVAFGVWALTALSLATRLRLATAAGAAVLTTLVPALVVVRWGSVTGVPSRTLVTGAWVVLLIVLAAAFVRARSHWERPSAAAAARALVTGLPGVVGVIVAALVALVPGAALLAWATRNDSANNVMFIRFMLEDSGVDPTAHPNPAFFLQGLVSLGLAPDATGAEMLGAYSLFWIGSTIVTAVVLSAVVVASVRSTGRAILGALVVGAFVYSWYVLGFSMTYGFANVPTALVLLGCSLLTAVGDRETATLRTALLVVGTVLLLATWAPLAIVPVALGVAALAEGGPRLALARLRAHIGQTVVLASAAVLALGYVVTVVVPDLRSDGGNLSQGGAFFALAPWPYVVIVGLVVVLAGLTWYRSRTTPPSGAGDRRGQARRALLTMLSGSVALGGFVALAVSSSTSPWTYYPQKLAWIMTIVGVVLVLSLSLDVAGGRLTRVVVPAAAVVVVAFAVTSVVDGPGVGGYVPAVKVARGIEPGAEAEARHMLHLLDDPTPKVLWLFGSTRFDDLANMWLVAGQASSVDDPIRDFAATIEHSPQQVCQALSELGPESVVLSNADGVQAALDDTCPELDPRVVTAVPPGG